MRLKLLLQALLFTFIVTGPELFELLRFDALSPKSFSDWDEPYYFPIAIAHGRELLAWFQGHSQFPGNYLTYLLYIAPQEILSGLIGLCASVLHLRATTLGVLLDVGVSFFSYIIFSLFYRALGFSDSRASTATIVTLFFPWLLYLPQFFHIPLALGKDVVSIPHGLYPCQPIVRGLGTQLSYPIFGLALLFGLHGAQGRRSSLILSGVLSGILIYFYFFAWPATIALISLFLFLSTHRTRETLQSLLFYTVPALIVSIPALITLYSNFAPAVQVAASATTTAEKLPDALWYFSAEQFLLLLFLSIWLLFRRDNAAIRMCVAAIAAEFLLMNSQKLLGIHTAPYHFPLLYLNPILSGALFVSLLGCLKNIELKSLPGLLLGASIVLVQAGQLKGFIEVSKETGEFVSLVKTIEREVPANGIVMFPPSDFDSKSGKDQYHYFTIPYWINALTERPLYANFVGGTPEGTLPQNLLSGWVYFGAVEPFVPCPKALPTLPGDILSGMMTREYWARYFLCQKISAYVSDHPLCKLFETAPFDFVVWQHSVTKELKPESARYLEALWKSADGEYELFRFNRGSYVAEQCDSQPQDSTSTAVR